MTKSRESSKIVTQAEAEAGVITEPRSWTPERVAQAIAALGGGGGGTPGGSNGQVQYNDNGAFGGLPITWDPFAGGSGEMTFENNTNDADDWQFRDGITIGTGRNIQFGDSSTGITGTSTDTIELFTGNNTRLLINSNVRVQGGEFFVGDPSIRFIVTADGYIRQYAGSSAWTDNQALLWNDANNRFEVGDLPAGGPTYNIVDNSDTTFLTVDVNENCTFAGDIIIPGNIENTDNTSEIIISGGNTVSDGANIQLKGGADAIFPGDMFLRSGSNFFDFWDESSGQRDMYVGSGTKSISLRLTSNFIGMYQHLAVYPDSGTASNGDILAWNSTNSRFEITANGGAGAGTASGEWTVALTPTGGSITLNGALETLAWYRVGDLVFVNGRIRVSSVSSPTGDLSINGLPYFARFGQTDASDDHFFVVWAADASGSTTGSPQKGDNITFLGRVPPGTKTIQIRDGTSAGDSAPRMTTNTEIYVQFTYRTDDAF